MSEEIREHAEKLVDGILRDYPTLPKPAAYSLVMSVVRPLFKAYINASPTDGRSTAYSVRLVLHKETTNEIVITAPWEHNVIGLDNVWHYVHGMAAELAEMLWKLPCPPELSLDELKARTPTARVSMSRKANGVAAVRFPFQTLTGVSSIKPRAPGEPGRPEGWVLRVDVGPLEAGRALEAEEIATGSPLVSS